MGFFTKAGTDKSLAVATLRMGSRGEFDFSWQGDASFALRVPAIYLDWALNKDQKRRAIRMLDTLTAAFADASPGDPEIDSSVLIDSGFRLRDVEVSVGVTDKMRADVSFRPRTAVSSHLYVAFAGLWNGLTYQLARDGGDEAIQALFHDMQEQLTIHREMGVSMRGGVAPILAGQHGSGQRLEREVADAAGLSIDEFRTLPDHERSAFIDAHTDASLSALHAVDSNVSQATSGERDVTSERDIEHWPMLDLDAVWAEVTKAFRETLADRGKTQLYYPDWFVRRLVTLALVEEAVSIRPEVGDEFARLIGFADEANPFREDPELDEEIDAFLIRNHLSEIVAVLVQGLSAED